MSRRDCSLRDIVCSLCARVLLTVHKGIGKGGLLCVDVTKGWRHCAVVTFPCRGSLAATNPVIEGKGGMGQLQYESWALWRSGTVPWSRPSAPPRGIRRAAWWRPGRRFRHSVHVRTPPGNDVDETKRLRQPRWRRAAATLALGPSQHNMHEPPTARTTARAVSY